MAKPINRTLLNNVLIAVSALLIVLLSTTAPKQEDVALPNAPKLSIDIWQTDSGARVWFSPYLSDVVHIQIWFLAGFGFDGEQKGVSYLLAQDLQYSFSQQGISAQVDHGPDFIKVALQLSITPHVLNQELAKVQQILYRPELAASQLSQYKQTTAKASDVLWAKAFAGHQYEGPQQGNEQTLQAISRANIQQFARLYLHPQRAYAAISADLVRPAAQVIMEKLLPPRNIQASNEQVLFDEQLAQATLGNAHLYRLPGSLQLSNMIDAQMLTLILNAVPRQSAQVTYAASANALLIQNSLYADKAMEEWLESGIMPQLKRKMAKSIINQAQTAAQLSYFLAKHNAYGHSVLAMEDSLKQIEKWDVDYFWRRSRQWLQIQ